MDKAGSAWRGHAWVRGVDKAGSAWRGHAWARGVDKAGSARDACGGPQGVDRAGSHRCAREKRFDETGEDEATLVYRSGRESDDKVM